ncbi:MAG: ATP-binding protein [Actinomycetota bacterium]
MDASTGGQTYRVHDRAGLSGIRKVIRSQLEAARCHPSDCFDCLIAVTEACTHALLHGASSHPDERQPRLSWSIEDHQIRFCLEDLSTQTWARSAHPARSEEDPLLAATDGYRVTLMRELMDSVEIARGPSGTRVVLTKRFA